MLRNRIWNQGTPFLFFIFFFYFSFNKHRLSTCCQSDCPLGPGKAHKRQSLASRKIETYDTVQ
jgi:hypothetical protein